MPVTVTVGLSVVAPDAVPRISPEPVQVIDWLDVKYVAVSNDQVFAAVLRARPVVPAKPAMDVKSPSRGWYGPPGRSEDDALDNNPASDFTRPVPRELITTGLAIEKFPFTEFVI